MGQPQTVKGTLTENVSGKQRHVPTQETASCIVQRATCNVQRARLNTQHATGSALYCTSGQRTPRRAERGRGGRARRRETDAGASGEWQSGWGEGEGEGEGGHERPAREQRDRAACEARLNATAPPNGLYCPGTFDSWQCWPATRAGGLARAPCPDFVPGFRSDRLAHKECLGNGSWWSHPTTGHPWSNYTNCVPAEDDVSDIIAVYEAGYGVSLVALVASLGILLYFRSLRCARITVHMNLFASFALNNALWLVWYALVMRAPATLAASPAWCRALNAALQYALLTNYTWMLCEGLYLHTVLVHAFVSERRLLRALLAAGWLLPLPSAVVHAARRALAHEDLCWLDEAGPRAELAVLVCGAVLLNLAFLCNIVRVLCGRAAGGGRGGRGAALGHRAARAARHYLLTPFRPGRDAGWWLLYEYVSALCSSLQGLCVAVLYCFCNGEVLAQLRRRWRVLTFRPRANSTTNTTVSFVRSAAPGGPRTRCDWRRPSRGATRPRGAPRPRRATRTSAGAATAATSASSWWTATRRRRRTRACCSCDPGPARPVVAASRVRDARDAVNTQWEKETLKARDSVAAVYST
ncbi:hypothetical protein MSG28_010553, partial [Choristoneura fumiferana]